jgi:hypothetical protein
MAWYDRLISVTSFVPYYCPHCFARYYRPHRATQELTENIRKAVRSRFERGQLSLISDANVTAGSLLMLVGLLALYWNGTTAILMVLFGMTSLLSGLGCLAFDCGLRRLARVESQIEQLRQSFEEQRKNHVVEHAEATEDAETRDSS